VAGHREFFGRRREAAEPDVTANRAAGEPEGVARVAPALPGAAEATPAPATA
jgi:hypothetical protein